MNMTTNKICRFCMFEEKTGSENIINPFDETVDNFNKKFSNCLGIHIACNDDIIPRLTCNNCASFIKKIMSFVETAQKSEHTLQELYGAKNRKTSSKDNDKNKLDKDLNKSTSVKQSTTQITKLDNEVDSNSADFLSCDSNSSLDDLGITRSGIKIVNEFSLPDLRKEHSSFAFEENDKVEIFKTNDDVYSCNVCSKEFKKFCDYTDHQKVHDLEFCLKCNEGFQNKNDLIEHQKTHKVSCSKCNIQVLPSSLEAHMNKHSDIHKCTNCDARHTSKAAMEKHYKARHAGVKGAVCHVCGKQNSCQSSMKRHLASHLTLRPFKCEFCNFSAKSRTVLRVHVSRKHSNERCNCEICSKMFKSALSLKQHVKRMHNPKKHECGVCGKVFSEKFNLDRHVAKKHSKQRMYECKVCHKEFFTVKKLKEHMHSHRQGCVSCPKCNKEFFYKKYLDKHLLKCCAEDESLLPKLKNTFSMPNNTFCDYNE